MIAYTQALIYNADYLTAVANNKAGAENIIQGRALLLPQLSANGTVNENYLNANGQTVYYHQPTLGVSLSQVLFDFNKFSTYSKNKYQTNIAALKLENAKQKLMVDVATAYFDVLYANNNLTAIVMTKKALDSQLQQATRSFSVGKVTITDVNDAKSAYDNAYAEEIKAQNDLINKKNILQNIIGLDANKIQEVKTDIDLQNAGDTNINELTHAAKLNNLNIKIANYQLQMANEDINIAHAGHLPTVNLIGSYNNQGNFNLDGADSQQTIDSFAVATTVPGSTLSSYSQASIGVQVSIPLYNGGSISSQARQASANYEASMQQLNAISRLAVQDIQNAYWQIENGINLIKAQIQALKSASIKLKSDKIGYQIGLRSSIDLVNSEKNYYQTLKNYHQARYQYLIYRLQLIYLTGKLDMKILEQINKNINITLIN